MPDVTVPVTYVPQATLYYCGPATAQMVLATIGVPSPATPPSWQDQLYAYITANTGSSRPASAPSEPTAPAFPTQKCERCGGAYKCWSTTPAVLVKLLNASQAVGTYSVTQHVTEQAATAVLLDTLDAMLPGVALVFGWQHWLVVDGYRHSEAGSTAVGTHNLNGVYLRNPLDDPNNPLDGPVIHYVDWIAWRDVYLSFVPCGFYKDKMVVLPATRNRVPIPPPASGGSGSRPPTPPPAPPTGVRVMYATSKPITVKQAGSTMKMIDASAALQRATAAADDLRTSRLTLALTSAAASYASLVQRLDQGDAYYYIVTFKVGPRETARVLIDARDGTLLEAAGISEPGASLPPYLPGDSAMDRLASLSSVISEWEFVVHPGTVGQHPVLVWKPCGQSKSPLLPFYQFSIGDTFVYLRVDGQLFDSLTDGAA